MVIQAEFQPIDRRTLSLAGASFGLPLPSFVVDLGMFLRAPVESMALKAFQSYLHKNGWALQLHNLALLSDDNYLHINGLRVECTVTDYPKLIAKILPLLQKAWANDPQKQPVLEVLDIIGDDLQPSLKGLCFLQNEEKMAGILGVLLRENQSELCERFHALFVQKQIPIRLTEIKLYP